MYILLPLALCFSLGTLMDNVYRKSARKVHVETEAEGPCCLFMFPLVVIVVLVDHVMPTISLHCAFRFVFYFS